jgi:hypothetical protein
VLAFLSRLVDASLCPSACLRVANTSAPLYHVRLPYPAVPWRRGPSVSTWLICSWIVIRVTVTTKQTNVCCQCTFGGGSSLWGGMLTGPQNPSMSEKLPAVTVITRNALAYSLIRCPAGVRYRTTRSDGALSAAVDSWWAAQKPMQIAVSIIWMFNIQLLLSALLKDLTAFDRWSCKL